MFIRTGLAQTMFQQKWMPVISEHTMRYKRPLNLFQKYVVSMEVVDWDKKSFHMVHTFTVNNRVVAEGTSKGVIVSKHGVIEPDEVIQTVTKQSM
jgi:acyl-CoA thioesterase FadM